MCISLSSWLVLGAKRDSEGLDRRRRDWKMKRLRFFSPLTAPTHALFRDPLVSVPEVP